MQRSQSAATTCSCGAQYAPARAERISHVHYSLGQPLELLRLGIAVVLLTQVGDVRQQFFPRLDSNATKHCRTHGLF